jgi:hypothetical protein
MIRHVASTGKELCTKFWWENLQERTTRRPTHTHMDNIKMDLKETGWEVWTGFMWLNVTTRGGLL